MSSAHLISEAVAKLFDEKVDRELKIRRLTIDVNHVKREGETELRQLGLFDERIDESELEKEKRAEEAMLKIKKKYGKNAILKGINFEEGATGRERNAQIGGHRK
jgi:DNA polymerase V